MWNAGRCACPAALPNSLARLAPHRTIHLSSTESPNRMDQFAKETLPVSLEEEMRRSYLDYAMSVIVGRALPDVRDGLKPVHRRVL